MKSGIDLEALKRKSREVGAGLFARRLLTESDGVFVMWPFGLSEFFCLAAFIG